MRITVNLYASYRIGRFKSEARVLASPATVGSIVEELGVSEGELGIVLLNGSHASLEHPLKDGDALSLLPRISGG